MIATQQPLNLTVNVAGFAPATVTLQPASSAPVPMTPAAGAKVVMKEETLTRVKLQDFLVKQIGRFVGIDYIKVDGSDRMLNGRLGVQKHLKGGDSTLAGSDKPYLVVYDVKAKGYRAVNLATVKSVRAQHTRWTIVG